jgi:hypothetical protein
MYGSFAAPLRRWWTCQRAAASAAFSTVIQAFIDYLCLAVERRHRVRARLTCTADHSPRRLAAGMPRSFSAAAMHRSDLTPAACSSAMVGARSVARSFARSTSRLRPAARAVSLSSTPRLPPSFLPRALAAANAALVRLEISPASSSATATIIDQTRPDPEAESQRGGKPSFPISFQSRDLGSTLAFLGPICLFMRLISLTS